MNREDKLQKRRNRRIRLTARIWGSIIILYVLIFVIGAISSLITNGEADPYAEEDIPTIEYSGPILMVVSTIGLAIAWRFEGTGGMITAGGQVLFLVFQVIQRPVSLEPSFTVPIVLSLFVIFPGILYLIYWNNTREKDTAGSKGPAAGQAGG